MKLEIYDEPKNPRSRLKCRKLKEQNCIICFSCCCSLLRVCSNIIVYLCMHCDSLGSIYILCRWMGIHQDTIIWLSFGVVGGGWVVVLTDRNSRRCLGSSFNSCGTVFQFGRLHRSCLHLFLLLYINFWLQFTKWHAGLCCCFSHEREEMSNLKSTKMGGGGVVGETENDYECQ